ncbi:hypothetical protein [Rhodopila globiformis]|uniref:hypothetical protein n=1 Tax=Rhodopila globiformis TaxID=1071 RepID=UPI0011B0E3EE|nr:hypothetical protein [Rhodopila globiformis]
MVQVSGRLVDGTIGIGKGGLWQRADVERPVVPGQHDRLAGAPGHRSMKRIDLLGMRHKIAAAPGRAGMHHRVACDMATGLRRNKRSSAGGGERLAGIERRAGDQRLGLQTGR